MGTDYTDFVQRNDQNITPLELLPPGTVEPYPEEDEDDSGSRYVGGQDAILVKVPKTYSIRDILYWSLSEFNKFPVIEDNYSFGDVSFEDTEGYYELYTEGITTHWYNMAIWESPKYPGFHLVNFEYESYHAFVQQSTDPLRIPWAYYKEVFNNRARVCPRDKLTAFHKLVNSGAANLWNYDEKKLTPYNINPELLMKKAELLERPIFRQAYQYDLPELPNGLTLARNFWLVHDNLRLPNNELRIGTRTEKKDSYINDQGLPTFHITFVIGYDIDVPDKLKYGCAICGEYREPGSYMCDIHPYTQAATLGNNIKILQATNVALANIAKITLVEPPEIMLANFSERGVTYSLTLTRHKL